jgi:RNA polymerase sigma-70 factor (ECF subfamily)
MLGSFHDAEEIVQEVLVKAWKARESYTGAAPLRHWLFRIATNACLNARRADRARIVPCRAPAAAQGDAPIGAPLDPDAWVTAAPDDALFGPDPARALEARESVAFAFVGLLQALPARQRAVFLLKDVVDYSVEEIAETLEMSTAAVSSALHRARASMPASTTADDREPSPDVLREYVRCWETRDLDGLLALLRSDVILAMPPWAIWYEGRAAVKGFVTTAGFTKFWSSGLRVVPTRANGHAAVLFYRDGGVVPHSIQLLRFDGNVFTSMCNLIGAHFLQGFEESRPRAERFLPPEVS